MANYPTTTQIWPDSERTPNDDRVASFSHDGSTVLVHSMFHVELSDYLLFHDVTGQQLSEHLAHWRGEQLPSGRSNAFDFVDQRNGNTITVRYAGKPVYRWLSCDSFSLAVSLVEVS